MGVLSWCGGGCGGELSTKMLRSCDLSDVLFSLKCHYHLQVG